MARARNIKPGFFQNDKLGELEPLARLAFIGMWTISNFNGCIEYRPKMMKVQLLPYDECDIEKITINLEQAGFIRFYYVQGKRFIKILNFTKHQNPHKNERDAGSDIPDINEQSIEINGLNKDGTKPDFIGTTPADSLNLIPDSLNLIPDSNKASPSAERFQEFWNTWPATDRRTNKAKCLEKWKRHNLDEKSELILDHVFALKKTDKWLSGFEPAPLTYLNGKQWEDGLPTQDRAPGARGSPASANPKKSRHDVFMEKLNSVGEQGVQNDRDITGIATRVD